MKIDVWVIALDETNQYQIAKEDALFISKIEEVYLFDRNRTTNTCELTPSYDLKHLYTLITFPNTTTTQRGEDLQDAYAYGENADIYTHVKVIDRVIEEDKPSVIFHGGHGASFDDVDYDDQLLDLCEYFRCSRVL